MRSRISIWTNIALVCFALPLVGCKSFDLNGISDAGKNFLGLKGDENLDADEILDPLGRRSTNRILLDDLAPGQLAATIKSRTGFGEDRPGAEKAFAEGKDLYEKAVQMKDAKPDGEEHIDMFNRAGNQFRVAGRKLPDSQLEHDALFFEGESYYFANRYVLANRAYENLIVKYSGTKYLDKAEARRFSIATYWLERSEKESSISISDTSRPKTGMAAEARRILHRIRLDDPTGKLADDATMALANAFFKAERWFEAADTYEDLRRNYPGSKHQYQAHLFELKARMNSYHGKSYDSEPLEKADKILRQLVNTFPEHEQEREYLEKEAAMIRHLLAEREWSTAKYYENRGENRAAQYYYARVNDEYSDTQFADVARQQIEKVAELPPVPEQRAQWLVNLFPSTKIEKPVIASQPGTTSIR